MRLIFTISFCFIYIASISAQVTGYNGDTKDPRESLRYAEELIANGEYSKAVKQLRHTIKIKKDFAVAHRLLGKVYLELAYYENATLAYEKSFDLDNKLSRAAFFECAEAYFNNAQIDLAMHYYTRYEEMKDKRYANAKKESGLEVEYDYLLPIRQGNCAYIMQMDTVYVDTEVKNLGRKINSEYDEYLPSITSDGENLLYTRDIKSEDENIYLSVLDGNDFSLGKALSSINTKNNEGMAKFEAHGNAFYFAGSKRVDDENIGCDIFRALYEDGHVHEIQLIEGRLNSYYWDSQPTVTCDGNKMFFSSTRDGGHGGADIWMCEKLVDGEWGIAVNMGPNINTPGDEEAPFIATDGVSLYFTSDGHEGHGNGDIFVSWFENGDWSMVENLGYPINSPSKEIGLYIKGDGKTAYFASARRGGLGGLDIYEVEMPELLRPAPMVQVEIKVVDSDTFDPVAAHLKIGSDGKYMENYTNDDGWLFQCLEGDKGYSFQVNHPDYNELIDAVYLEAQDNQTNEEVVLKLELKLRDVAVKGIPEPIPVVEKAPYVGEDRLTKTTMQLFFGFDSASIDEKNENKLVDLTELINRYDDWSVEVIGYADNVGSVEYNKQLSEKRAQSIVNFLKKSTNIQIETNINAVGKGTIGSAMSDENSRKLSRRVDIILTR